MEQNLVAKLMAPYDGLPVSLEYYWQEYCGQTAPTYEWNNGILEFKPGKCVRYTQIFLWMLDLLNDYHEAMPIADVLLFGPVFQFNIQNQIKVRVPDFGVVLHNNPVPVDNYDQSYSGIFDICIECIVGANQNELERFTILKKYEYAQAGVKEYYILDELNPRGRNCETAFYRLGAGGIYQPILPVNGVIQSTVLPGFQFRVDDLENRPNPIETLENPVYRAFTSPYIRAERKRAEAELETERERAEEERGRAEQSIEQIEQIRAYLDSQGIVLPDELRRDVLRLAKGS